MGDLSIDSNAFVEYTDLQGSTIVSKLGYSPFLTPEISAPALVQKKDRAQPYGDAPNPADYLDGICSNPGRVEVTIGGSAFDLTGRTGDGAVTANSSCPR